MKQELDDLLCEKYPRIFAQRHGSPHETCMYWGFSCGDGWFDLIDTLCANIQSYVDGKARRREFLLKNPEQAMREAEILQVDIVVPEVPHVEAAQVKEKFGGLRFYVDGGDDYIKGLISMAESMSFHICEDCGNKGSAASGGWIKTLCGSCHDKRYEGTDRSLK